MPRGLTWSILVAGVSLAVGAVGSWLLPESLGGVERTAWLCAGISVAWSLVALTLRPTPEPDDQRVPAHDTPVAVVSIAALATGLGAGVILVVIMTMRIIYFALAQFGGGAAVHRNYGFTTSGLLIVMLVTVSTGLAALRTRRPVFITVLFWLAALGVTWSCFLSTAGNPDDLDRLRSPVTLYTAAGLTGVLCAASLGQGWSERRRRWRFVMEGSVRDAPPHRPAPGLRASSGAVAVATLLLCCYHLVVPAFTGPSAFRSTAGAVAAISLAGGGAVFHLVGRRWSRNLADVGMGLMTIALCAISVTLVPVSPALLSDRFPMVFNAMVFALATAAWLWTWLSTVWEQQLDGGTAWTPTGHLIPYARHFSFAVGCLALLVAAIMSLWPRLPRIAAMDHTLGRFAAGIAGHLYLLWVTLWCARRVGRTTFHLLGLLVVLSTAGFVLVRVLPFTPRG